jgi:sugar diacid utilization regulator/GAF domain-containing protein
LAGVVSPDAGESAASIDPSAQVVDLASWLTGIHTFIGAVNNAASLGQLISLVAETACKLMSYNFCGVLLLREEARVLIMEASHGFTFDYAESLNRLYPLELNPESSELSPSTRAFLTGKPVIVKDVRTDPLMNRWRQLAAQQGYRSMVSAPLMLKERPFGVLNCYHRQPNQITDSSVELLGILANQVGWAVEATHLRDLQQANLQQLAKVNQSLRQQGGLLRQAEQIHRGLNQVALRAGGMDDLATELETLLHRAVYVDDVHGRPLTFVAPGDDRFASLPEVDFSARTSETVSASSELDGQQLDWSVTPILLEGNVVARIWVPGTTSMLGELDLRALEEAAVIGALDILRSRTALEIEWRVHGDIINDLLDGGQAQFEAIMVRSAHLGHDLSQPHTMLVVDLQAALGADSDRSWESTVHLAKSAVLSMRTPPTAGPLMTMREGYLVILDPVDVQATAPDLAALGESIRLSLNRALSTQDVRVAVGAVCEKLGDLTRMFRVGRGALTIHAIRRDPAGTIVCPELGLLGLLLQVEDSRQLAEFANVRLARLRQHDETKGTALIKTLETYFTTSCHLERTAQQLYVHPNTVRLRLRRAEALLEVDLSSREAQIDLHTAFLVDEVARSGS